MKVFTYDSNSYDFVGEVSKVYGINDLSEIQIFMIFLINLY